jgi:L-fuconolactonase
MNTVIDTHLHVWEIQRFHYHWITPAKPVLYRDHSLEQALARMLAQRVAGAVLVEANNSLAEAAWLLDLAEAHPAIFGVVGWCDFASPHLASTLAALAQRPKLKGVRPPLPPTNGHWDAGVEAAWQRGLELLATLGLSCDLLVQGPLSLHLAQLIAAHPQVVFVLNHFGGARLGLRDHLAWAGRLEVLAAQPNVNLKLSGFLTAAQPQPLAVATLRRFLHTALECFGAERLLFGSDHPVSLLANHPQDPLDLLRTALDSQDGHVISHIFAETARRVYKLID